MQDKELLSLWNLSHLCGPVDGPLWSWYKPLILTILGSLSIIYCEMYLHPHQWDFGKTSSFVSTNCPLVQEDPKLLDDAGEIPKSQGTLDGPIPSCEISSLQLT